MDFAVIQLLTTREFIAGRVKERNVNLRHSKKLSPATIVVPLFILLLHPALAGAKGPMQTIWGCRIPCAVKTTKSPLKGVYITYCAVSSLGLRMIEKATPECQSVNHRADAVAVRNSDGAPATCDSSSNVCTTEGPVNTGFVCKMLCPSEDSVIHKFSTCASTGSEAWSFATQVCKDAKHLPLFAAALWDACTPDGQTPCE